MIACRHCGRSFQAGARFCPGCGRPAETGPQRESGKPGERAAIPAARRDRASLPETLARNAARLPLLTRLAPHLGLDELSEVNRPAMWAAIALAAGLGGFPSPNGHIETTPYINLVMPAISYLSPALGFLCALVFGAVDLIEKMLTDNIYYNQDAGISAADYVGARLGYVISYLAVVGWGVLPGVMGRRFRNWARRRVNSRNLHRSVGAAYVGGRDDGLFVAAMGALGGFLGGGIANIAALPLEIPAFFLRANPDFSCFHLAVSNLINASSVGEAAIGGGAIGPLLERMLRRPPTAATPQEERPAEEEEPEPEPERPEWSLANRPSVDHRWDPETGRWVLIEDLEARKMRREGYVFDAGGTWVKPPSMEDIKPLEDAALGPTSGARTSRQWSDLEAAEGDYASIPSRLTSAVDAYNLERHRLQSLDGLYDDQLEKYRRVTEELEKARKDGHAGLIDFLEDKRLLVRENIQKVQRARDDAVKRLSHSGDEIVARGLGATMHLGLKGSVDTIALIDAANLAGRPLPSGSDRRSLDQLAGQKSVFRESGESAAETARVRMDERLPQLRVRPGDRLFAEPFANRTSALESEALSGGTKSLPVIRARPGEQFVSHAPTAYGGKNVVIDNNMKSLGQCNLANPSQIKINTTRIAASAQKYQAPYDEWEILSKQHECTHLDKLIGRTRFVAETPAGKLTTTPLAPPAPGLANVPNQKERLLLQHVSNNVITEQRVQQQIRQDFLAGRIRNVSKETFAKWETFNRDRLAKLQKLRVKLLEKLNLTYRP